MKVLITINGEPRAKGRPRVGTFGPIPDKKTAAEEVHIAELGRKAMRGRPPMVGPVRMRLEAVFSFAISWPKRIRDLGRIEHIQKPDLDNIIKLSLDALNGIVFLDDSLVCEIIARKRHGEGARIDVSFEEIPTDPYHPAARRAEHRRDNPLPPTDRKKRKAQRIAKPADRDKPIGTRIK